MYSMFPSGVSQHGGISVPRPDATSFFWRRLSGLPLYPEVYISANYAKRVGCRHSDDAPILLVHEIGIALGRSQDIF
jgi:hypothetical protein